MSEKYNATCSICGRPYYKCISCRDKMALNPWKAFCDTAEHYKVHQVISGFNSGIYTKEEAKDKFNNIDISDVKDFRPNIKQIVEDIIKEDKPIANPIVDVIIEPVEDSILTEEVEEAVIEKPVYSRKRNYNMEEE